MGRTAASSDSPSDGGPPVADDGTDRRAAGSQSAGEANRSPAAHTRISGYFAAIVASLVVLVILIVFILENGQRAKVTFLGAHGHLPLGVALLLAAVIGGAVVAIAGVARILQLRRRTSRQNAPRRQHGASRPVVTPR